ncbi:hypothetical protein ACQCN2_03580 [Brevibacillus ginsengisoli]|uniref:hypothetical protein n=1 Tax=Brevibacillus ginsengisoli TaxID=363854 RepID=UPI003CFAF755
MQSSIKVDWANILKLWEIYEGILPTIVEKKVDKSVFLFDDCTIIDWWEKNTIDYRVKEIEKKGFRRDAFNGTGIGLLNTGKLLMSYPDEESQILIWIYASIFQMIKNFPEEWRGETYEFLISVDLMLRKELINRNIGSLSQNTKYTLPIQITTHIFTDGIIKPPKNVNGLIKIVVLESHVINSTWNLVNLFPE